MNVSRVVFRALWPLVLLIFVAADVKAADICFEGAVPYPTGNGSLGVTVADWNGDTYGDLAVANLYSGDVSVLLNNGDGTYAPAVNYSVGARANSTCASDLDGDGILDLVVSRDVLDNNVAVFLNNGNGTFMTPVVYSASNGPSSVTAADMNGDGHPDLVVANEAGENVSVLMNDGSGAFAAAVNYPAGNNPWRHCTVDLNGDGTLDVAVANIDGHDVSVLLNNGNGTLAAAVHYPAGNGPNFISCADLDQDSDVDLIVTNGATDLVSVLMNNGNGSFAPPVSYPAGDVPFSVYPADLDLDGDVDLAVTNDASDDISILINNGDGSFDLPVNYVAGDGPRSICAADLDGDGDYDLATANFFSGTVTILKNCAYEVMCDAFLTPHRVAIGESRFLRTAPRGGDRRRREPHTFMIHLLPCEPIDVSVGDSAEVFVDVDTSGTFDADEQYPAVVSSTDQDGTATDIAIKVFVGEDLIDNDPLVAIYSVAGLAVVETDGNKIDYLQLDTFTPGNEESMARGGQVPIAFELNQNYPNPFNTGTAIRFVLPAPSDWTLGIYNVIGRVVEEFKGSSKSGYVTVNWDATDAASGVYFYKVTAGDFTDTKKMVLMK